jgi:hypothetical protein
LDAGESFHSSERSTPAGLPNLPAGLPWTARPLRCSSKRFHRGPAETLPGFPWLGDGTESCDFMGDFPNAGFWFFSCILLVCGGFLGLNGGFTAHPSRLEDVAFGCVQDLFCPEESFFCELLSLFFW